MLMKNVLSDFLNKICFKKSTKDKIESFLKSNCAGSADKSLLNIRQALVAVLLKLPDSVIEDLTQSDDPVVIVNLPNVAGVTSFYQRRNKLRMKKGVRIVMFRSELNNCPVEAIMRVVAHELAHAYLHARSDKKVPNADIEANKLVAQWGLIQS